jgi:hypothetical protein
MARAGAGCGIATVVSASQATAARPHFATVRDLALRRMPTLWLLVRPCDQRLVMSPLMADIASAH